MTREGLEDAETERGAPDAPTRQRHAEDVVGRPVARGGAPASGFEEAALVLPQSVRIRLFESLGPHHRYYSASPAQSPPSSSTETVFW